MGQFGRIRFDAAECCELHGSGLCLSQLNDVHYLGCASALSIRNRRPDQLSSVCQNRRRVRTICATQYSMKPMSEMFSKVANAVRTSPKR